MVTLKHNRATINVRDCWDDLGGELQGECAWTFSVGDLRRVFKKFPGLENTAMVPDAIGDAIENAEPNGKDAENFGDLDSDDAIRIQDADSGILIVAAMIDIGGEWSIDWEGENVFWLFHDWCHITYDTSCNIDDVSIYVDADREARAFREGAKLALASDVSLSSVCEALASSVEPFNERFGHREDLFAGAFEGFKVVPV